MSKLRITSAHSGEVNLNVIRFQSPLYGTIVSAQAKHLVYHFPIKLNQPDIRFDVVFRSEYDYELFQSFVRSHQVNALTQQAHPELTLFWPERNIDNWSGFIKNLICGGKRFNPVPRATFVIELVDSMVASRTRMGSFGVDFWQVVGPEIQDSVLNLPSVPWQQQPVPPGYTSGPSAPGSTPLTPPGVPVPNIPPIAPTDTGGF